MPVRSGHGLGLHRRKLTKLTKSFLLTEIHRGLDFHWSHVLCGVFYVFELGNASATSLRHFSLAQLLHDGGRRQSPASSRLQPQRP